MAKKQGKRVDEVVDEVMERYPEPGGEPVRDVTLSEPALPPDHVEREMFCREGLAVLADDARGHVVPSGEWRRLVREGVRLVSC